MKLGDIDSGEIAKMAIKDDELRMFKTPFGRNGGSFVLGKNVPWAGVKGIEQVRKINPEVAAGLEKARDLSKDVQRAGDNKGVVVVRYPNGDKVTMPRHSYKMMERQNKNVELVSSSASVGGSPGYKGAPEVSSKRYNEEGATA